MNAQTGTWLRNQQAKREQRYAAKLQEERFDGLRRRPVRRALVVLAFLLLLAACLLVWWDQTGVVYLAVAFLAVAGIALLQVTVRASWPAAALDERHVEVRNDAYRVAYGGVAVATGLALFVLSLAWQQEWGSFALGHEDLRAVLLGFIGFGWMAPGAVLAWREREV